MKLTKGTIIIGLGVLSLCLGAAIRAYFAFAQSVPKLINYQGSLTDKDGNPITTEVPVRFSIYAQDIGGSPLWTETQIVVPQENGIFSVLLGSVEPFPDNLFKENPALYLGVQVGSDSEMTPRQQIVGAAYAQAADLWVIRHDDVQASFQTNQMILTGWGYMQGNKTRKLSEPITFAHRFKSSPIVAPGIIGYRVVTDGPPTEPASFNFSSDSTLYSAMVSSTSATGFVMNILSEGDTAFDDNVYIGYSWIAIGTRE